MDWDSFLLDRANTDLKMYKNFDNIVKDDKHINVRIKDRKLYLPKIKKTQNNDIFINRYEFIENILNKCNLENIQDCTIPIYIHDSYDSNDDIFSFCWSKPYTKKGLLFPCWSFNDWEKIVKEFDNHYVEWKDRSNDPYFVGANTSRSRSNIRTIMQKIYPEHVIIEPKKRHPIFQLMDHKLAFDLGGVKPWSVRSPYIALSGCVPIKIIQYYSKWHENTWIQFYENPSEIDGLIIDANYDQPLKEDVVNGLEDKVNALIKNNLKKWQKARAIRERMRKLKTNNIINYLEYIFNYIGNKQNM